MIFAFLKSILVSAVIAGCKKILLSKLPDWLKPESVRQWIITNLPTLVKIVNSTKITWDDFVVAKIQAICNDPVMFEVIYNSIIDSNTAQVESETIKQTLRERIRARLSGFQAESSYDDVAPEITSLVNAIKQIKQFSRT
jgi:hypothetical protein